MAFFRSSTAHVLAGFSILLMLTTSAMASTAITIEDIAQAIRRHVTQVSRGNNGFFPLEHDDRILQLKLIRIHMEYLADLGGGVQFACVDLVEEDGTVYDVDFFLSGKDRDNLVVSETHVHKLDGQPLYTWEQQTDGTWHRVAVEDAGEDLLGVIRGEDHFTFTYHYQLPELHTSALLWLPLARSDARQQVTVRSMTLPAPWELLEDADHGNSVLHLRLQPAMSGELIEIVYDVSRLEATPYPHEDSSGLERYLRPYNLIPLTETFETIAKKVTAGIDGDLSRARELYKHTVEEIRYARFGDGWGQGDAVYACDIRSGNCSDFHSYFIALARSVGIPARYITGVAIPSERDDGGVDGYHCWAEFYADGKWWPVDISEANKINRLADYFFGRHPANRFEFNRGRDLVVEPGPSAGPINFLAYPTLEIDGEQRIERPKFLFERKHDAPHVHQAGSTVAQSKEASRKLLKN